MKTYKGRFKPKNPQKYLGDPTNIIYRSWWEFRFMRYLDSHKDIIKWSGEEIALPYRSPLDGRIHRYFPDFFIEKIDKDGNKKKALIEIKPKAQVLKPERGNKTKKRFLTEVQTWGKNQAKWESAKKVCKRKGWDFIIMTEDELGIK